VVHPPVRSVRTCDPGRARNTRKGVGQYLVSHRRGGPAITLWKKHLSAIWHNKRLDILVPRSRFAARFRRLYSASHCIHIACMIGQFGPLLMSRRIIGNLKLSPTRPSAT
jgi:hypothetical protein